MSDVLTLDALLAEVHARGLRLAITPVGPRLQGPREQMTPALVACLKRRREEIVSRLAVPDIIHWLTASGDACLHTMPERRHQDYVPVGVAAWRLPSDPEDRWRPLDTLPPEWKLRRWW